MSDEQRNVGKRRDKLLLRLLKTPPLAAPQAGTRQGEASYSDSRQARQRRKARACCLGVRGFVRLSIQKPLALGAAQECSGAIGIVVSERERWLYLKSASAKVTMQVGLADIVELAVNGALEQSRRSLRPCWLMEAAMRTYSSAEWLTVP